MTPDVLRMLKAAGVSEAQAAAFERAESEHWRREADAEKRARALRREFREQPSAPPALKLNVSNLSAVVWAALRARENAQ